MDTGILNVSFSLRCELLAQVCGVLVLDVFHNRVPASPCQLLPASEDSSFSPSVIVDLVAVARGIDNIQSQANTVLFDHC